MKSWIKKKNPNPHHWFKQKRINIQRSLKKYVECHIISVSVYKKLLSTHFLDPKRTA